jgi:phospholipid/cholesterol/gamma-HCH transport system substrate-binding protein
VDLPLGRRREVLARLLTLAALLLAVLVIALLLFSSGGSYRITITLDNASQLVKGNQVKVGGVPVGTVSKLELAADGQAQIELDITDEGLTPLHRGSTAEVRSTSLSGISNRYVALKPGPNNQTKIASGGSIPAKDAQSEVDLDAVLNTLTPETLGDLQSAVRGLGGAVQGRGKEIAAAIHTLNPALSQTAATSREIIRDEGAFSRFLVDSASVVSAVSARNPDLERLVPATGTTLSAIASRTSQLDSSLRQLPPTLREANTTLVNLRGLVQDLRPAVREARPVAPLLNETLTRLQPVARGGVRVIPGLRRLIDTRGRRDLIGVLSYMPTLAKTAVPAFDDTVSTVDALLPIVKEIRPYTPDLFAGPFRGFGGSTAPYWDANGRYTRISFAGSGFTIAPGSGQILPILPENGGVAGYRTFVRNRCPGGATAPAPDKSNPFLDTPSFPCDVGDTGR